MATGKPSFDGDLGASGIFARSFLVQASWSYRWMQNLGMATMLLPVLRRINREKGTPLESAEARAQTEFFNAHPYLAGGVAGISADLKLRSAGSAEFLRTQVAAKEALMGPLGALGDDFFWSTLRPLTGCIGVLLAMAGYPWIGLAAFLVFYNAFHLRVRWQAVRHGLEGEERFCAWLERIDFHRKSRVTRRASALLFAVLPLFWAFWDANPWRRPIWQMVAGAVFFLILSTVLMRRLDPRQTVLVTLGSAGLIWAVRGIVI